VGRVALLVAWLGLCAPALAQDALLRCSRDYKDDDRRRLLCYDAAAGESAAQRTAQPPAAQLPPAPRPFQSSSFGSTHAGESYLTRAWRLGKAVGAEREVTAYRPAYVIWRWTDAANQLPGSPGSGRTVAEAQHWQAGEAKYQLSAKADLAAFDVGGFGIESARLWLAYTQQSHWQVANGRESAPFRETDYEPELIASLKTAVDALPALKLVNLGMVHQSNGRSLPQSRSWHRVYVQAGIEPGFPERWGRFSLLPRAWWRLPEGNGDDNSDISTNVGRGELLLRWESPSRHIFSLLARSNLSMSPGRGFTQLDWLPRWNLAGPMKVYVQLTSGYGESLIDYNHRQNTLGAGIAYEPGR
jgi:phospholipase A1